MRAPARPSSPSAITAVPTFAPASTATWTSPPLQTSNPGRIFENILIQPLPAGGTTYGGSPGDIHAYDVRTGKLVWTFHTVPHPGEFGYETWPPEAWKTSGGVHNWNEMTLDEKRGIAYIPLGTARYDFYGADRKGADLFGNSLLALDARTGKRLWHFQTCASRSVGLRSTPPRPSCSPDATTARTSTPSPSRPNRAFSSSSTA